MPSTSLPSIHEMFPDHLMRSEFRRPRTHSNSPDYRPIAPNPMPSHCSTPGCHCAAASSSSTIDRSRFHQPRLPPDRAPSTTIDRPRYHQLLPSDSAHPQFSRSYPYGSNGGNNLQHDFEDDDCPVGKSTASIDGALGVNTMDALGRKHVCPTCFKRFNRPSSLRIHLNTHTGATPFKCPWPKCGREFNVNSNMRRHYRNHLGAPRGQGNNILAHANDVRHLAPATNDRPSLYAPMPSPPSSYSSLSDEGLDVVDEDHSYSSHYHSRQHTRQDKIDMERLGGRSHVSSPSISQASSIASRTSSPTGTDIHSSSSGQSPQPKYNASKPYSASLSDARVRTTLRPAFM